MLDAPERDFDLLPKPTQEHIRGFLAERITNAQEEARTSGDPEWRSRLAQILGYRRWFDLRLEYRTPRSQSAAGNGRGDGWRTLDRGDHGLFSGGAKVVTLMQPFVAALHAMYVQASGGPRMLWLDEAFGGVDAANKASMFRLLASCDLDWLIAGPEIIANSAAVPLAAIYEVRRAPQPLPGVSLELGTTWVRSGRAVGVRALATAVGSLGADVAELLAGTGGAVQDLRAGRAASRLQASAERERAAQALVDAGVPAGTVGAWLSRRGLPAAGRGRPSAAAMRLLTGLAEAGAVLHIRADDDPAGQEIVSGIMKAIPGARLWRFALRDPVTPRYEEQDIDVLLRDLRLTGRLGGKSS